MNYQYISIFFAGGFGSITRYYLGNTFRSLFQFEQFYSTLLINVLGSFVIGIVFSLVQKNQISQFTSLSLMAGFCGGFTTFSAFSLEAVQLLQKGDFYKAIIYILLSFIICLGSTFAGIQLFKTIQ